MSKIAAYLQEHIAGEVTVSQAILKAFSTDGSVLELPPEMVVYPRLTSDIRKIARFAWQLADKGHVLPLTARGNGSDQTGGAIGTGVILSFPAHMNRIFEFDPKQKLIRLQPGVSTRSLGDALSLHGMALPAFLPAKTDTVGGAIAFGASGPLSGRYGNVGEWIHQLEVVLASGDVLQTQRLSKRDLSKKKGAPGLEGEIYRQLDNLIEDNKDLINGKLLNDITDNVGYSQIAKVKQKDGSFDLTPLFVGSQGTLGIISEMIMKVEFISSHKAAAVIVCSSSEAARDLSDHLLELNPAFLEYIDGKFFDGAAARGKTYDYYKAGASGGLLLIGFKEFSERANAKKLKKLAKLAKGEGISIVTSVGDAASELEAVRDVTSYLLLPAAAEAVAPALFDGVYIPREHLEGFLNGISALSSKHGVTLPVYGRMLGGLVFTRPALQPHKVADKQKIFKLLDEYTTLVTQCGGHLVGMGSEGRLKAPFAYRDLDEEVLTLFKAIKAIFDPYGILNPGVKQPGEVRQLVPRLRSRYDTALSADQLPTF